MVTGFHLVFLEKKGEGLDVMEGGSRHGELQPRLGGTVDFCFKKNIASQPKKKLLKKRGCMLRLFFLGRKGMKNKCELSLS